jgi:hypothetical protein
MKLEDAREIYILRNLIIYNLYIIRVIKSTLFLVCYVAILSVLTLHSIDGTMTNEYGATGRMRFHKMQGIF